MSDISRKIANARPPLSKAAPLTFAICWGFAVVNVVLGLGLILLYSTPVPIAVANILSYREWGVLFLILAIVTAYGLITNNWNITRRTQLIGVLIKTIWMIALIFRSFMFPPTILITAVWFFFVYVQGMTYVHFVPTTPKMDRVGEGDA
jgi:hypothetical protein